MLQIEGDGISESKKPHRSRSRSMSMFGDSLTVNDALNGSDSEHSPKSAPRRRSKSKSNGKSKTNRKSRNHRRSKSSEPGPPTQSSRDSIFEQNKVYRQMEELRDELKGLKITKERLEQTVAKKSGLLQKQVLSIVRGNFESVRVSESGYH